MGGSIGLNGHAMDIGAMLDTRKGGYTLAILLAFLYPIVRFALDRCVFGVSSRAPLRILCIRIEVAYLCNNWFSCIEYFEARP